MLYAQGPLRTLWLAAAFAVMPATSLPSSWLLERDGTCAANFNKCPQAGLPANFCCSAGASCNVLAGGTTVLCCPSGSDCATIETINCALSLQDPAANPKAGIKTTELNGKLPTCGKGCCPFGYHCDETSINCVMDQDQSKKPGDAPSSTPSPSSVSSTPSTTGAAQTSKAATVSTPTTSVAVDGATTAASSSKTPSSTATKTLNTAAIVGGVVGGIAILLLIAGGFWLMRYKRKKAEAESKKSDSPCTFGNTISAPIPHADYYAERLDFLAKAQSSSIATSPTRVSGRFLSPSSPYSAFTFRRDSEMTDRPRSYHASAEVGGLRNLTDRYSSGAASDPFSPRGERQNSGGSESINIFADPTTVRSPSSLSVSSYNRRQTTWSDLQHQADGREPDLPFRR
ncbi:hypothetical protein F4861DRAFT_8545 [Xylaria intraflava]|nr:hypothetical protein F4861DRAFT_8545 [Xylaria intraflava]